MDASEYARMLGAEDGHWWYRGTQELVLSWVAQVAGEASTRILDAGCGTGRLAELLMQFGTVEACDRERLAVEATRCRGISEVKLMDLSRGAWGAEERFDVITCIDVLYHEAIADEVAVLRRLRAALRVDGWLILQVPAFSGLHGNHDRVVQTRRRYLCREVSDLLKRAGLEPESVSYRLLPLFLPLWLWRRWAPVSPGGGSDLEVNPPQWLQRLALDYVRMENRLLRAGRRLPLGTSVFAVARRRNPGTYGGADVDLPE